MDLDGSMTSLKEIRVFACQVNRTSEQKTSPKKKKIHPDFSSLEDLIYI